MFKNNTFYLTKKIIALVVIFLFTNFFTTGVSASCTVDASGAIVTAQYGKPVTGNVVNNGGGATDQCQVTPIATQIKLFKLAVCKQDTSYNDLSSCQYMLNSTEGIFHTIEMGKTTPLNVAFTIEPGIYPYALVVMSNKTGVKSSFQTTNTMLGRRIDGTWSQGNYCWTDLPGPTTYNGEATNFVEHGQALVGGTPILRCGATAGTPNWSYEIKGDLSTDDDNDLTRCINPNTNANQTGPYGDRIEFGLIGNGNATQNLLKMDDSFATTCENSAKILWTSALITPLNIVKDSTFDLKFKQTDVVWLGFDWFYDNDTAPPLLYGAGPQSPELYIIASDP